MLKYLPTYYSKYQLNCFFLLFIIRRQHRAGLSLVMEPVRCDCSTSVSAAWLRFPFRVPFLVSGLTIHLCLQAGG